MYFLPLTVFLVLLLCATVSSMASPVEVVSSTAGDLLSSADSYTYSEEIDKMIDAYFQDVANGNPKEMISEKEIVFSPELLQQVVDALLTYQDRDDMSGK